MAINRLVLVIESQVWIQSIVHFFPKNVFFANCKSFGWFLHNIGCFCKFVSLFSQVFRLRIFFEEILERCLFEFENLLKFCTIQFGLNRWTRHIILMGHIILKGYIRNTNFLEGLNGLGGHLVAFGFRSRLHNVQTCNGKSHKENLKKKSFCFGSFLCIN